MAAESKPANGELIPDLKKLVDAEKNGEPGNGRASKPPKVGRLNVPAPVKGRARKLTIDDKVFERLEIDAKRRTTTLSALANDILDRTLPHFEVSIREVKKPKIETPADASPE